MTTPATASAGMRLRQAWPAVVMWLVVAAVFANALLLTRAIANPMVMADNWLFVDTFLRHAIDGTPTLGDFLVKRAGLDHGLPHYKLLMLLNARYFGLDFSIEAMVGVAFGLLGWLVLLAIVVSEAPRAQRQPAIWLLMAAVAAVHLSLNAVYVYLYSMVTLSHINYVLAFLMFFAAWRALQGRSLAVFAIASFAYAVAADTSAILTALALAMAVALETWHSKTTRRAVLLLALLCGALVMAHLVYAWFGEIRGSTLAVFNVPLGERLAGLAAHRDEAWRWIVTPTASSLVGKQALQFLAGNGWQAWQLALSALVLVAHGWFWWKALRRSHGATGFVAVCTMLLSYGYVAGVLYGRVFLRGSGYLDQMRYIGLYQLGIIAVLLMLVAQLRATRAMQTDSVVDAPGSSAPHPPQLPRVAIAVAVALIALQAPLTRHAWSRVPAIAGYDRTMAAQYGEVLRDPTPSRSCVDQLTLCQLPPDVRMRVVDMLRRHRLNLLSPAFQRRHPALAAAAFPPTVPPPAIAR